MKIHEILAVAAIGAIAVRGHEVNSNYTEKRDRLHAEQAKALAKKQRVRAQIRARRTALKAAGVSA